MPRVYQVTLPASIQRVLTSVEQIVSLEFTAAPLHCLGVRTHAERLVFWIVLPLALVAGTLVLACVRLALHLAASGATCRLPSWAKLVEVAAPTVLKVLFVTYPIVTTVAFESFPCTGDYGAVGRWLTADVSIRCDSQAYRQLGAVAWIAIAIYPVGLLVSYALLLLRAREAIVSSSPTPLSQALAFLHREYRPNFWWWELVDMLRRLLLVGFAVVVLPGSINQLALALLLALLCLVLQLQAAPFRILSDGYLATGASFFLVLLLASCIVLKTAALTELPGVRERLSPSLASDYSVRGIVLSAALLLSIIGSLLLGTLLLSQQVAAARARRLFDERIADARRLRDRTSHKEVLAPLLHSVEEDYHLFLSHVWSTGQDQMRVVKQRLREMLPEVRVFLDVDDLEEIGDLERYIDDSAAILVFCSAGYCESRNCMRELCHAVAKGVPLVALLEEAGRDGAPDEAGFRRAIVAADARRTKWEMAVEPVGAALGDALFAQPALEWNRLGVFQDVTMRLIAERLLPADVGPTHLPGEAAAELTATPEGAHVARTRPATRATRTSAARATSSGCSSSAAPRRASCARCSAGARRCSR